MQVSHFPAAAVNSLIEGYCDDFVSLAAVLSQTLEQVSMRGLDIGGCRPSLARIENGMRALAEAIHELVDRLPVSSTKGHGAASTSTGLGASPVATLMSAKNPSEQTASAQPSTTRPSQPAEMSKRSQGEARKAPPAPQQQQAAAAKSKPSPAPCPEPHPIAKERAAPAAPAPGAAASPGAASNQPIRQPSKQPNHPPGNPPVTAAGKQASSPPNNAANANTNTGTRRERQQVDDPGTLRGSNDSMPLLSVFQFLERTRKSGVLTVEMSGETIRFGIEAGCVQSCVSSAPCAGERLGDLVCASGLAEPGSIEAVVREAANNPETRDGRGLGDQLVQRGLLTNGQLMELLEAQARQRFRRACGTLTAGYTFVAGDPTRTDGRMRLAPMELNHRASWDPVE